MKLRNYTEEPVEPEQQRADIKPSPDGTTEVKITMEDSNEPELEKIEDKGEEKEELTSEQELRKIEMW